MGLNYILGEIVRGASITEMYRDYKYNRDVFIMSNGRVFARDLDGQYLLKEAPLGNPHRVESQTNAN